MLNSFSLDFYFDLSFSLVYLDFSFSFSFSLSFYRLYFDFLKFLSSETFLSSLVNGLLSCYFGDVIIAFSLTFYRFYRAVLGFSSFF